jgi:hypothetical protein
MNALDVEGILQTDWDTMKRSNRFPGFHQMMIKLLCTRKGLLDEYLRQATSELLRYRCPLQKGCRTFDGTELAGRKSFQQRRGIIFLGNGEFIITEYTGGARDTENIVSRFCSFNQVRRQSPFGWNLLGKRFALLPGFLLPFSRYISEYFRILV